MNQNDQIKDRKTEREKDRKTGRQEDEMTKRQKDRKTENPCREAILVKMKDIINGDLK